MHLVGKSITNVTSTTARYCNKLINIFPNSICCAKTCKVYPGRKEGRVEILGVFMHNHVLYMHIQVQIITLVTFTPTFEMNLFLMWMSELGINIFALSLGARLPNCNSLCSSEVPWIEFTSMSPLTLCNVVRRGPDAFSVPFKCKSYRYRPTPEIKWVCMQDTYTQTYSGRHVYILN